MKSTNEMTKAFLGVVLLFVFTLPGQAGAQTCIQPPPDLVSWLPGDGNANDIVDANHGTPLNGATFAAGQVGMAFSFDGVDDYVSVANSANLNIPATLTVDAWFNLADIPASGSNFPVVLTKGPTNAQYIIFVHALAGSPSGSAPVVFRINTGPSNPSSALQLDLHDVTSATKVVFGQWMHVAGVYDGFSIKVYVNGVLESSTPVTGTIASDARPLTIGAGLNDLYVDFFPPGALGPLGNQLHGTIDEVEIFDRALTASEIQAIFNAGSAGKCKGPVMIQKLIGDVLALNLQKGITNSLDGKLDAALHVLDDVNQNNDIAAINALQAFINAVEAQRGVQIPEADADTLIAAAQAIITQLTGL